MTRTVPQYVQEIPVEEGMLPHRLEHTRLAGQEATT